MVRILPRQLIGRPWPPADWCSGPRMQHIDPSKCRNLYKAGKLGVGMVHQRLIVARIASALMITSVIAGALVFGATPTAAHDVPAGEMEYVDQDTFAGETVVREVEVESGQYFIAVWSVDESTEKPNQLRGVMGPLEGESESNFIELTPPLEDDQILVASVHADDGDGVFDPVSDPVITSKSAQITVIPEEMTSPNTATPTPTPTPTATPTPTPTETESGGQPGFGIGVALVALLAVAGLARRRR